ncbi:MAG: hypothetical protein ACRCV9_06345 [Burkholderiaceae bacterium]
MNRTSKLLAAVLLAAFALGAQAQSTPKPKEDKEAAHKKETVAQHRAMAKAHEDAAKCLESGKEEKACHDQMQKDCKGIGIGKYCGMRHSH